MKIFFLMVLSCFFVSLCIFLLRRKAAPAIGEIPGIERVLIISVDGLGAIDIPVIEKLPAFSFVMRNGSISKNVESVLPASTYPSHTSIISGHYPSRHGIVNNELPQPGQVHQAWNFFYSAIKVPTLISKAAEMNMKTASVFWPVTAGAPITYNMPEIWPINGGSQFYLSFRYGSPWFSFLMHRRYGHLLDGKNLPNLDHYSTAVLCRTLKDKKPQLALLHLFDLDHFRHEYGAHAPEIQKSFDRLDKCIQKTIDTMKKSGLLDTSVIVILGDHGFSDVHNQIFLNVAFKQKGLLNVDHNNNILNWLAYANYCDGSAQIHVADKHDVQRVYALLQELKSQGIGIARILTKEEAADQGLEGDFEFVAEAREGCYFVNGWKGNAVTMSIDDVSPASKDYRKAVHGYSPELPTMKTVFMIMGPGIKAGFVQPEMRLIDVAPTLAEILGIKLGPVAGRCIHSFFSDKLFSACREKDKHLPEGN